MKSLLFTVVMLVVFAGALYAQSTTIKLPTATNSSSFVVTDNVDAVLLKIFGYGGFYMLGNSPGAALPVTGAGVRLMWDPYYPAFRAGSVSGAQWDAANTGAYSTAMGYNTTASGLYSTAIGYGTTASGSGSTSIGQNTTASGPASTSMGFGTTASSNYATAMGDNTIASGLYSTAIGYGTTASGQASTSMGRNTTASEIYSTAMGLGTTASGAASTAIGSYVSTGGFQGSCIIGDASTGTTVTSSTATNQMIMRFAGGYNLYSNAALSTGVSLNAGASGWTVVCDRNKKQSFRPVDGEELLKKIRTMPITEWSYKGTDLSIRYIGPMAQDFYSAFHLGGKDSLGINSICIDGVNMAAIQALEKRTAELQKATAKIAKLESDFVQLKKEIAAMMELKPSSAHASLTSADLTT